MSYGSNPTGGFNEASLSFKEDPTLENYLALRRADPAAEIEVSFLGGLDAMFAMEAELAKFGFEVEKIVPVLDADVDAISALSMELIARIVETRKLIAEGETQLVRRGLALPDKLINWLICLMLNGMSWKDELELPRELVVLICDRLGGTSSSYLQTVETAEARSNARMIAASLKAQGLDHSLRRVAEILKISPSTLSRWFEPGEFEIETEKLSHLFDRNGRMKPLSENF